MANQESVTQQQLDTPMLEPKVLHDRFYWNFHVGPAGDILQVEDVSLQIPEGALDREHTITLVISCNKRDMPQLNADQRLFGPIIHCLPHGLEFMKPAKLSFDCSQDAPMKDPPNVQVWQSDSDVGEDVNWKVLETQRNSTNEFVVTINHMCVYVPIVTRSGKKVLRCCYKALVYTSSNENERVIEVRCVHKEHVQKNSSYSYNETALYEIKTLLLQDNGKTEDNILRAGTDVSISITYLDPNWTTAMHTKTIKFCEIWDLGDRDEYPSHSFVLTRKENTSIGSRFCTLTVGQENCEISGTVEFTITSKKMDDRVNDAPKPKELIGYSQRWDKVLLKLIETPEEVLVDGLKSIRLCTKPPFKLPVQFSGANVYVGLLKRGRKAAIKVVHPEDEQQRKERENEANILVEIFHNNIVHFMAEESANGIEYYATGLCDYTLREWITEGKHITMTMVRELLEGLNKLHCSNRQVLQCDLSPDNVLVLNEREDHVKIADFGYSILLRNSDSCYREPEGTDCWKAQEVIACKRSGNKVNCRCSSDVQVAGMLVFFMMSQGIHPYHAAADDDVEQNIVDDIRDLTSVKDAVAVDLVEKMLSANPDNRPRVETLLRHGYFWNDDTKYQFLSAIGDEKEVAVGETTGSAVRTAIESCDAIPMTGNDWSGLSIIPKLKSDRHFEKDINSNGYTKSVCKLLRLMRNIASHTSTRPSAAQKILGKTRYPFAYFNGEFPKLFPEVYLLIKDTAGTGDDWTQRELLKIYF